MKLIEAAKRSIYYFTAASPGGFRITLLLLSGIQSKSTQAEVSNDTAIIAFLSMLTAIGAGNQILHIASSYKNSPRQLKAITSGLLRILLPYILTITAISYFIDNYFRLFSSSFEGCLLLFCTSIYWISRHIYLSTSSYSRLFIFESSIWAISGFTLFILYYTDTLNTKNILLSVSIIYLLASTPILSTLFCHPSEGIPRITSDAISIGLSNLVSGGVSNLLPSLSFHSGNPELSAAIALTVSITSIPLTFIRAKILKALPEISIKLKSGDFTNSSTLEKQTAINKFLLTCLIGLIFPLVIYLIYTHPTIPAVNLIFYTGLTLTFVAIPQLVSIESAVLNFLGASNSLLAYNVWHAFASITITTISYLILHNERNLLPTFLIISSTLYLIRNIAINNKHHEILKNIS